MRRFLRDESGVHFDKPSPCYNQEDFVSLEVKAGSLVVIHGDLIHQRSVTFRTSLGPYGSVMLPFVFGSFRMFFIHSIFITYGCSFENQSSKSRHAYSLHVVDTNGCKWAEDNW